jgi:hypothetical protein
VFSSAMLPVAIAVFEGSLIMPRVEHFGGAVYDNQQFKNDMNSLYFPLDKMKASVEILKASDAIDMATMEFGQYQPILAPRAVFVKGPKFWWRECGFARIQLSAQPNTTPLSKDQPNVVPLTMCDLMDACVRKCFNSDPPICMKINVIQKQKDDPNSDQHEIKLIWDYGAGDVPILLNLTMVCPFMDPFLGKKPDR